MTIDIHTHITDDWARPKRMQRLLEVAGRFGIERLVVSMAEPLVAQPTRRQLRQANDFVLDLKRAWPERIIGFCYLNPRLGRFNLEELDRCLDAGMRGIKLWVAIHCDAPEMYPIVERAIERDIPILQHTWLKTTGNEPGESEPRHMAQLAERYGRAKLIMAHAGGNWAYGIKAIRPYPNVTIDTSGANPTQGFLDMALRELGPQRIAFGSDAVFRSFASQIAKVDAVKMPALARRMILEGNATRLLCLCTTNRMSYAFQLSCARGLAPVRVAPVR